MHTPSSREMEKYVTPDDDILFPFKPGDWVMNQAGRVATVKAIDHIAGETMFDLVLYSRTGAKIGRESPAMGGPRTFEPCCSLDGWERCVEPSFPLTLQWVTLSDGRLVAMHWAKRLPPADWRKPKARARGLRISQDADLRRALENIADGHNNPRQLAREVLGR